MNRAITWLSMVLAAAGGCWIAACAVSGEKAETAVVPLENAQVPAWSEEEMDYFLHGSISTEVVPEVVLRTFIRVYPDLFPKSDLSDKGLIPDPAFGWPIGFSKARPAHLAGMASVGVNCAACHVAEVRPTGGGGEVRVLGATSLFDSDAYFGAVLGATYRTMDPANMKKFLAEYLDQSDPEPDVVRQAARQKRFASLWDKQAETIAQMMTADPGGMTGEGRGGLQEISPESVRFSGVMLGKDPDLSRLAVTMLKLFHNMRTALHVQDKVPTQLPPDPGPGRNDAFGLLSAGLFAEPQAFAPVKFGLVWNVEHRKWVHWDGNTRSPLGRNLLAAVGLGAPVVGHEAKLDFALVKRQTELSEQIQAPKYPWAIDHAAAERGRKLYVASCASCHDGVEDDRRLHAAGEVGTDPLRAQLFTQGRVDRFNKFLAEMRTPGYVASEVPGLRSTGKYWAASLVGVWARSPYLHNGSVRTMEELLMKPALRAATFHRGSNVFDPAAMGYLDEGAYLFDTKVPGNSNGGHDYGTGYSAEEKRELIEFLKTL